MDLAYLRSRPSQLPTLLKHQRIRETPVTGGDICLASRLTLDDGSSLFVKTWPGPAPAPAGFFAAEAAGLRWLAEAGAVPVPEVIAVLPELLALVWVQPVPPKAVAAERFGRDLAAMHRAGADQFGAPWPGYIGRLPQDNTVAQPPWADWFAQRRLGPQLRASVEQAALSPADVALVEQVMRRLADGAYGGEEPPARIHGDLWPGNLLWAGDRVWLVDPAAHGGHRETDLATLALFGGAPQLDRILASYQEVWPLAEGWQARVPVHQLYLLLVHTASFGSGWREAVVAAAQAALRG